MASLSISPAAAQGGSAINKVKVVSAKLSGDESWKDEMFCFVESQSMLGFIDGSCEAPPPQNDAGLWRRIDLAILADVDYFEYVWNKDSFESEVLLTLENWFSERKPQEEDEHLALYKAAMRGDWDTAKQILEQNPSAVKGRMTPTCETPLHIAVSTAKSRSFVRNMVDSMADDELFIEDYLGFNPLHTAAVTGNLFAAELLVNRLPDLLYVPSYNEMFPIHLAAEAGHRQTLELFISHTRDDLPVNPFAAQKGLMLLNFMIDAEFFDLAMDLVDKYPHLAWLGPATPYLTTALKRMALREATFCIEPQLNSWECLVYSCIQLDKVPTSGNEMQNCYNILGDELCERWRILLSNLHSTHWKLMIQLVPCIEWIHENKLMHAQGLQLVRRLCQHMESLTHEEASAIYGDAMITTARLGMHDAIQEIVRAFPAAIHYTDPITGQNFLHWAQINQSEKVFNHAINLLPSDMINLVWDTALWMKRGLQLCMEIELYNYSPHSEGIIFTKKDRELKVEGEKWMKDTAKSCTIAAALVATTVFSAAMTVPRGNKSSLGYPTSSAFTIFAVSDAISLLTCTASLLMFLSFPMSEEQAVPKRLCIGVFSLSVSILFMMIAFGSAHYLACKNLLEQSHRPFP